MCGIAGLIVREPGEIPNRQLERLSQNLLRAISGRGGDATGILVLSDSGERMWRKASCDVLDFLQEWRRFPAKTSVVLLHTRFATQGHHSFPENNHPIRRGPFYVVHNGHVWNDDAILPDKKRHGTVDSEAIAFLLERAGSLDKASEILPKMEGDIAFAAVDERNPRNLTLVKGQGTPLTIHESNRLTAFASTPFLLSNAWRNTYGGKGKTLGMELFEGMINHYRDGVLSEYQRVELPEREKLTYTYTNNWMNSGWCDVSPASETLTKPAENKLLNAVDEIAKIFVWKVCLVCGISYIERIDDDLDVCNRCADPTDLMSY